ncbi:hypothetical protein [Tolumonas lignilytica]|uniref:hypothetical protein n=1 Tax=Tolumonas lignilytica TaxID=1283284 RepID=UPI0004678D89|nr:hypothetical protein [Tolumonas lignilytica]
MKESDLERTIINHIENLKVGQKGSINFSGIPLVINVKIEFSGGWAVHQTIQPGASFEFVRGETSDLKGLSITFEPYDGLRTIDN